MNPVVRSHFSIPSARDEGNDGKIKTQHAQNKPASVLFKKTKSHDVKKNWRAVSLLVHPDKHPQDREKATIAFKELENARDALELTCPPISQTRQNTDLEKQVEWVQSIWESIKRLFL